MGYTSSYTIDPLDLSLKEIPEWRGGLLLIFMGLVCGVGL